MHKTRSLAGAAACLLLATALHAQQAAPTDAMQRAETLTQEQIDASGNVQALGRLAALYENGGDKQRYRWTMERLTRLLPGSMKLKLDLAASYAADDMKTPAYNTLLVMKGQGFGVDIGDDPRFTKIHGTRAWDYIVANLKESLKPFGKGDRAFSLPAADLLVDALAWDPARKQFLAGSARTGEIFRVDSNGKLHDFIKPDKQNQLWSVFALAVDAKQAKLWVATTSVVYFRGYAADNAGKAALLEFDLASGKLRHRYPLEGHAGSTFMSALALAPDGTVYAADGVNKAIYTVRGGKLAEVTANPHLNDIRAIAVGSDGKVLYLADTMYGIIGYDLGKKEAFGLKYNPDSLVLPGIVGLYWFDGTLAIVEPGMQPARVMRLTLSADGRSVTKAMPLDVAQPDFTGLDAGTIAGNNLYYIANSQRDKYDAHGLLREGAVLSPVHVYRSDLRFAWNESGINTGMHSIPVAKPGEAKKLLQEKPAEEKKSALPSWMGGG
jgi:hypothetical protein